MPPTGAKAHPRRSAAHASPLARTRAALRGDELAHGPWVGVALLAGRAVEFNIFLSGSITNTPWNGFGWVPDWIDKQARYAEIPVWREFLREVVVPYQTFFLWFTFLIGLYIAVTIGLGLLVGFNGIVNTVWAFVIALGSYPVPTDEPFYVHTLYVVLPFTLWAFRSGRVVGVDAWLRPRLLASPRAWVRWVGRHGT